MKGKLHVRCRINNSSCCQGCAAFGGRRRTQRPFLTWGRRRTQRPFLTWAQLAAWRSGNLSSVHSSFIPACSQNPIILVWNETVWTTVLIFIFTLLSSIPSFVLCSARTPQNSSCFSYKAAAADLPLILHGDLSSNCCSCAHQQFMLSKLAVPWEQSVAEPPPPQESQF